MFKSRSEQLMLILLSYRYLSIYELCVALSELYILMGKSLWFFFLHFHSLVNALPWLWKSRVTEANKLLWSVISYLALQSGPIANMDISFVYNVVFKKRNTDLYILTGIMLWNQNLNIITIVLLQWSFIEKYRQMTNTDL